MTSIWSTTTAMPSTLVSNGARQAVLLREEQPEQRVVVEYFERVLGMGIRSGAAPRARREGTHLGVVLLEIGWPRTG